MGLKHKPPEGNVRHVAPIGPNNWSTITNKKGDSMQCEAFSERKLTVYLDRDPHVKNYRSQPLCIRSVDSEGKSHTYVPDFMVGNDGAIEIYEVTHTERRLIPNTQRSNKPEGGRFHGI